MGSEASFTWDDSLTKRDLAAIQTGCQRAAMYAIRQAGRLAKREMAAAAPVYAGSDPAVKRRVLRSSIKVSKSIGNVGGQLVNRVGPKTRPGVLYSRKAEQAHGYVGAGQAIAEASYTAVFDAAVDKVITRWK